METAISVIIGFALIVGIVFGGYYLMWLLWVWVVPQLWINGPENLLHPNFWLFCGAWFLTATLGKAIFGRTSSKD